MDEPILGGVRGAATPHPLAGLRARSESLQSVLTIFVLSRLAFYSAAIFGAWLLPLAPGWAGQVEIDGNRLVALHWRWDAIHYYSIALGGYLPVAGSVPSHEPQALAAFFPLLPLLSRGLALLSGGHADAATIGWAGIIVVQAAALLAFALLFELVRDETGDTATAQRAVLYLAIFPLAFYYAVPYAEPIFLATSLGCFLAARRRQWLRAGLWAAAASAARPFGILLLPVLLVEIGLAARGRTLRGAECARAGAGLLLAPLGLVLFMIYQWRVLGDPLAFSHTQQSIWNRRPVFPLTSLWRGLSLALHPAAGTSGDTYARTLLHTLIVVGFLGVLLVSLRRWRPSYVLYGLLLFSQVLAMPWPAETLMHTLGRAVMVLFPVYISLAQWGRRPAVHQTILLLWAPLYGLLSALYVCWYFVA